MDMRGKEILKPSDRAIYKAFIVGGILGDNPPRDRTKSLRDLFGTLRSLKEKQMSSDTAILVTSLIINDQIDFSDIPMIHDPEFVNPLDKKHSVQLEGFVYVSNELDINTCQINSLQQPQPIINQKISQEFLFEDFDLNFN